MRAAAQDVAAPPLKAEDLHAAERRIPIRQAAGLDQWSLEEKLNLPLDLVGRVPLGKVGSWTGRSGDRLPKTREL